MLVKYLLITLGNKPENKIYAAHNINTIMDLVLESKQLKLLKQS